LILTQPNVNLPEKAVYDSWETKVLRNLIAQSHKEENTTSTNDNIREDNFVKTVASCLLPSCNHLLEVYWLE
jgi:hypothetical protein